MGGVVSNCVAAAIALLPLLGILDTAVASTKFGSSELMAQCRGQADKQAVISACSEVIKTTRDRSLLERAFNRRGLAYTATKQFAQAVDDFTKVLQFDSKIAGYFDNRQRAFVGLGLFDDALKDANAAVKLAPTYPFVYHGRGAIYADMKRYDLAVQDFNTALSINASDAPLLVDRGKVFRAVGLMDNAIADFNNAHAIDPNFMGALRERGLAYLSLGYTDAARTDLTQVLASQPADQQDPEIVTALQQLSPTGSVAPSGQALAFSDETRSTSPVIAVPATPTMDDVRRAADQAAAEQRRKAERQAEAARQDAQAARDEAAAKLRKERFERASTSAKGLIDEASAFIRANPNDPKLLDYVQQIANLNSSLSGADPDDTEPKIAALGSALEHDDGFASFRSQREEERQRQNARYLADAVRTLAAQRAFVTKVVTRDPTSPNAIKLLGLIKEADAALASPALDSVQTVIGKADAALQGTDLTAEFAADQKLAEQVTNSSTAATPTMSGLSKPEGASVTAGLQLVRTEKNAFLLKGDLQDVVFMFNTSPQAPHVIRNLRGDIVFGDDRADVCIFGLGSDEELPPLVKVTLGSYETAKTVLVAGGPCDPDRLTSYDVIVTRRGTFMRQAPRDALPLVKALETDAFQTLVTVTDAQVKAARAADALTATAIAADVDKGTKAGFGLLVLTTNSPAICLVAQDQTEAHRHVLLNHVDKLTTEIGTAPVLTAASVDGAFANAKHGQCGAIYAAAADVKDLATALKRDGISYRFSALWVEPEEVKAAADKLDADKAAAEQQAAERQRQQAEEQRLVGLRAADEAAKLSTTQAASREQYGTTARAAAAHIAQDVKEFTEHSDEHDRVAERLFPGFASSFRADLGDRWELMSENDELDDYGSSDFKSRQLDTPFTRVTLNLKHRMLGDYKTECFVFGEIEDAEFQMRRDPIATTCDDTEGLSRWKAEHGFRSRWNLR